MMTNDERAILTEAQRNAGYPEHGLLPGPTAAHLDAQITHVLLTKLIYEIQFLSGLIQGEIYNNRR